MGVLSFKLGKGRGAMKKILWVGLGLLAAIGMAINGFPSHFLARFHADSASIVLAQSPTNSASPQAEKSPAPSPTSSASPIPPAPVLPPASTAPPLPLSSDYRDPSGRFRIGILKDFKVSPLAGSVLIESTDGNLAYSVVIQSQPSVPIGLSAADGGEGLAKVATTVFQRGEGFQPGSPQLEAGGGVVVNWTGSLTIGGNAQPMGGVILVRPSSKTIGLLLIAATQDGSGKVPAALSALASSLQIL